MPERLAGGAIVRYLWAVLMPVVLAVEYSSQPKSQERLALAGPFSMA